MFVHNNAYQRNANLSKIALKVWQKPGITRDEIENAFSYYRLTVKKILTYLVKKNFLIEKECEASNGKTTQFFINDDFGCVVGMEFHPTKCKIVGVTFNGKVLYKKTFSLKNDVFSDLVSHVIDLAIAELSAQSLHPLIVCIGIPGIINTEKNKIICSDVFNLVNCDFSAILSEKYKIPVLFENDANCCGWFQLAENKSFMIDNFVCLLGEYQNGEGEKEEESGLGIGLSMAMNGKVRCGAHHALGEFRSFSWESDKHGLSGLSKNITTNIADRENFMIWIEDLFKSLIPVISVSDPSALFIHGDLAKKKSEILDALEKKLPQFFELLDIVGCNLYFSVAEGYDVARGAAALCLERLLSLPTFQDIGTYTHLDWDYIFKLAESNLYNAPQE